MPRLYGEEVARKPCEIAIRDCDEDRTAGGDEDPTPSSEAATDG